MLEITSVNNEKIKDTVKLQQKKYRNEKGLFLLEGHKPIFEAYGSKINILNVYTTKKNLEKFDFIKDRIVVVNDAVLEKLSTTASVCEAVAVAQQRLTSIEEIKNKKRLVLIENIKDAGNLGTLLRSAAAFNIDAVILSGETIDLYNPKVVRSAVGALFKIPVINADLNEAKKVFNSHNFIATVVNHKDVVNPETIDYTKPFVIMLGSEADGLTQNAIEMSDIKTTIPIQKNTESLNLSVAGAIMFYITTKKTV